MVNDHDNDDMDSDDIHDPVNERLTLAERNERLQGQLRSLKEDLAQTRDETGETTMDRIGTAEIIDMNDVTAADAAARTVAAEVAASVGDDSRDNS